MSMKLSLPAGYQKQVTAAWARKRADGRCLLKIDRGVVTLVMRFDTRLSAETARDEAALKQSDGWTYEVV